MEKRGARRWPLVAAACLALGGGCIEGKVESFVRYDKATDSFACLDVYTDILARDEGELDHVAALWRRRENLVINPISGFRLFASPTVFERHGKHSYSEIPIAQKPGKAPEVATTSADLDAIRVIPGEFFLDGDGKLCGSHQVVIPGRAVDAAMRTIVPSLSEGLASLAETLIRKAGEPGSKRMTWDEMREIVRASLEGQKVMPAEAREQGERLPPLDIESLRLWAKAGADRSLLLTRSADAFTLVVPLTRRDSDQAVATVEMAKRIVAERRKAGKPVDPQTAVLDTVEVQPVEGGGLRVTLRVGKLPKGQAGGTSFVVGSDAIRKPLLRRTVAAIRARGIEVKETDLSPTILQRFVGTTLTP